MKKITQFHITVFLTFLLLGLQLQLPGQKLFPEPGMLFDDTTIPSIDVQIHPDTLETILHPDNLYSDHEYMASFTFTREDYAITIDSVGFRLRGNTSRYSAKKSFKISLNTFIPGRKYQGVEKINLNGEHNDPSISRARLSWYLFRKAGVPGSRANPVEFYINGEFRGVYLNVEHVDEEFVELRFGYQNSNLYKCLYPADLNYIGDSPELYKMRTEDRLVYELKRFYEQGDYSDLANFIDVLNNTPVNDFPTELERVFNVNTYLKNLAVEVLTGHWDAYAYNMNNYYLYNNQGTGKMEFIPYDPDNTFGISWFDENWDDRDIYNWEKQGSDRPLVERILEHPVYRDRYSFYMNEIIQNFFNSAHLDPIAEAYRDQISPLATSDIYRTYDYGFSWEDFYNSYDEAWGSHVRLGIKPFINSRSNSALDQLELNSIDPIITLLTVNDPGYTEFAEINFLVEDDNDISDVKIWYSLEDDFIEFSPDNRGNGFFRARLAGPDGEGELRYYMTATDSEGNSSRDPVEGWYSIQYDSPAGAKFSSVENRLKVYPNPSAGRFMVELPGEWGTVECRVLDATGRQVFSTETTGPEFLLELPARIPGGMYILQVRSDEEHRGAFTRILIDR